MRHPVVQKSFALLWILLCQCTSNAQPSHIGSPATYLLPLKTIAPAGNGAVGDLRLLAKWAKGKKYIGLGEITHGTKEVFDCKTRLVQFFVQQMGAKLVLVEANMADCYAINGYVTKGVGNPQQLLKNTGITSMMYEEYLTLLNWLKAYNEKQKPENKVQFWGYDIQAPQSAAAAVLRFLEDAALGDSIAAARSFRKMAVTGKSVQQVNPALVPGFKAATDSLGAYMQQHKVALVQKKGAADFHFFSLLLHSMQKSWQLFNAKSVAEAYFMRDSLDYENIVAIAANQAKNPVLIWAHNGHVKKYDFDYPAFNTIGKLMQDKRAAEYYAIGSLLYEGEVIATKPDGKGKYETFQLPATDSSHAEVFFAKQDAGNYLLNIPLAAKNKNWDGILNQQAKVRSVGNTYYANNPAKNAVTYQLAKQFDAVFFIRKGTAPGILK
jgi:erythromycin esterase